MNINYEDFKKLEIKIGKILSAEKIEGTDKLLKLEVEFGTDPSTSPSTMSSGPNGSGQGKRQIVSGIVQYYTPEELVGKLCPFVVNLEPRTIKGVESQGMILAADVNGQPVLLHPDKDIPEGSRVK